MSGRSRLSWRGRLFAALLYAGAESALSHETAAYLWKLVEHRDDRVHVSCAKSRRSVGFVVMHRPRVVDATEREGLRLTSASRTLVDISPRCPDYDLRKSLARADCHGLLDPACRSTARPSESFPYVARSTFDRRSRRPRQSQLAGPAATRPRAGQQASSRALRSSAVQMARDHARAKPRCPRDPRRPRHLDRFWVISHPHCGCERDQFACGAQPGLRAEIAQVDACATTDPSGWTKSSSAVSRSALIFGRISSIRSPHILRTSAAGPRSMLNATA